MPEVMEFYRMAGDVDYMLRVVVPDIAGYDTFYKKLIATVPLKNVTSRFAMERIKSTTALPIARRRLTSSGAGGAAVGRRGDARRHVHLVRQSDRAGDDVADGRRIGVGRLAPRSAAYSATASAVGSVIVPLLAVPLRVSLHFTVALPVRVDVDAGHRHLELARRIRRNDRASRHREYWSCRRS